MIPTTFRSAVGAALTVAVSAVLLPATAANAADGTKAQPRTASAATIESFSRIADAVLTERTAAIVDGKPARRAATLGDGKVRVSAKLARAESGAVSSLGKRKARLAALGEAYSAGDTKATVNETRVQGDRATVQVTETTTLRYAKVRGDEPATTGFEAHHEMTLARTSAGTWELTGLRSTDDGPVAINEPRTPAVAAVNALPSAKPAATKKPSTPQSKPPGTTGLNYKAMATYAEKYWKNYNPAYRKFNDAGGDCTNFVSQALKAGGWKHDSGTYDDYRNWWYDSSYQSLSWVGANEWSWFTLHHKRATNLANVYYMGVGDVMQMDFDRDGSKDHTMMTTYRSSSGVPYLTYHSVNTYRKSVASIIASYPNALYYAYRV
ncbi:amidase domain-containing protein [Streptomyces buecherae]|uniref:amidase domain-containing protein n=1 Tax=Streptomyces buecherae TaxID=2763006 RepID=UPI0027E38871|nr:amidase domain-containing protein [Streptomyces buecherae]